MAIYTAAITRHRPIQLQPLDRVWGTPTGRPLRRAAVVAVAKKAIEGVGDELNAVAAENMDFAPARRRVRYAFADVHRRLDHFLFKIAPTGIQMEERYEMNSKGVEVFWKSWLPKPGTTTKAALFFCHGYGSTCTFFFEGIAKIIADAGYAVFAMDYPGFGLSQGLHGYIPSFDGMVDHVIEQYAAIRAMEGVRELRHFLLGQSMGGAVALKIHLKQPEEWDGVLLVAPMCKAELNVISYSDQMRLRTAVELIKATQDIESQLKKDIYVDHQNPSFPSSTFILQTNKYTLLQGTIRRTMACVLEAKFRILITRKIFQVRSPLLILHGAADKVTDPNVSKILYNMANTNDKTLKLYEEGFHCILEGEPDGRILSVINDIISWLDSHSDKN
ncbi:caffeoylshikimate esterase-like isoform X2 [Musa acuminata AAA Group]|uniref:caffeoylshikimate esterase-like isoform X2 n=1 Tax=Musa acuminata AAA Group TaxID=214697 RepID=UPI0031DF9470